jgi:HSP20 family protein
MIARRRFGWPGSGPRRFDELDRMKKEMERVFEGFTGGRLREPAAGVFPLVNVTEDKDNYYVRAELPGVDPENLDVTITGENLTLSGERTIPSENEGAKYHRREREAGKFSRILTLPGPVDSEKVGATFSDGVLTVLLPKPASTKPRQISVKGS